MQRAAQRLEQLLFVLNRDSGPGWEELNSLWIDSLLEFDGMPEEHVLDRLGPSLRRRDRRALVTDIERILHFIDRRVEDPRVTVVWQ